MEIVIRRTRLRIRGPLHLNCGWANLVNTEDEYKLVPIKRNYSSRLYRNRRGILNYQLRFDTIYSAKTTAHRKPPQLPTSHSERLSCATESLSAEQYFSFIVRTIVSKNKYTLEEVLIYCPTKEDLTCIILKCISLRSHRHKIWKLYLNINEKWIRLTKRKSRS